MRSHFEPSHFSRSMNYPPGDQQGLAPPEKAWALASDQPGGAVAGMCGIRFIQLHPGDKCLDVTSLSEPHQKMRSLLDI